MRLKSIKLAGFKSFVDPTTVNFPSNLACVVGPNGCGKSNVIDAVRWVMGESSAKQLRGDSMTDVIFNGSGGRKPVGQASIELIFDNSSGRITGEYAGYNEISVRRRVSREGQSDYYLNGNRCRRRDITDIFLGTGLGPRSYSIIEQGMISNLITARPEDLRVYIEEAAGISKYKERRRDTENRIRRTRENLERLTDLRDELGRQIQRLHRQSQAAEKYKEFKQEERQLNDEYLALRWRGLNQTIDTRQKAIVETELKIEKLVIEELACTTEIEKQRENMVERTDAFNAVQSSFYEAGAEIARLEQSIKHQQELKRQLQEDLSQTERSFQETQRHLQQDGAKIEGWQAELEELHRQREKAEAGENESKAALLELENRFSECGERWEAFQAASAGNRQKAEVEQSRIRHFEQSMQSIKSRRERISSQLGDDRDLRQLSEKMSALDADREIRETALAAITANEEQHNRSIEESRTQLDLDASALDQLRSELQSARGRLSSLEALQEAALNEGQAGVEAWLVARELGQAPRLVDEMEVESGWEIAVETVLGGSLKAVKIDNIEDILDQTGLFKEGVLELLEAPQGMAAGDQSRLSAKTHSAAAKPYLRNVYWAAELGDALTRRKSLDVGESVITKDGIWLGHNWCRISRGELAGSGVIERKAEIDALILKISQLEATEHEKREQLAELRNQLQQFEEAQRELGRQRQAKAKEISGVQAELSGLSARQDQMRQQMEHSRTELAAADEQYQSEDKQLSESRQSLAEALDLMESDSNQRTLLTTEREELRKSVAESRATHQQLSQSRQSLTMREQLVSTQLKSLQETMERMSAQLERLGERRANLQSTSMPDTSSESDLAAQLEGRLKLRLDIERQMTESRSRMQDVEQILQTQERLRQQHQQSLLEVREQLQNKRIQAQDYLTRRTTLEEQMGDQNPTALLKTIAEDASEEQWSEQLARVQTRIERLGPINLAAIDEYQTEAERKTYLDEQNEELVEALDTLENAIRKIDRETRTRFRETFDKIDNGFKTLFPRLFGGGHAYLELTGDDLLETGITIMARPPGKRNSTIHLLSGGEKAMTAIALVFAIFQLNPAPFCMLDEVDAPLDDANVNRYANMLKEMSDTVQFIFITHNKVTMEMSDHLMGVTMHEPGVSRLVTVDVESAIKMVAV